MVSKIKTIFANGWIFLDKYFLNLKFCLWHWDFKIFTLFSERCQLRLRVEQELNFFIYRMIEMSILKGEFHKIYDPIQILKCFVMQLLKYLTKWHDLIDYKCKEEKGQSNQILNAIHLNWKAKIWNSFNWILKFLELKSNKFHVGMMSYSYPLMKSFYS